MSVSISPGSSVPRATPICSTARICGRADINEVARERDERMNHSYSFSLTDIVCSGLGAGSVVSPLDLRATVVCEVFGNSEGNLLIILTDNALKVVVKRGMYYC